MMQELTTLAEDPNSLSVLDELLLVYNYFSVTLILACPFFLFWPRVFLYMFHLSQALPGLFPIYDLLPGLSLD